MRFSKSKYFIFLAIITLSCTNSNFNVENNLSYSFFTYRDSLAINFAQLNVEYNYAINGFNKFKVGDLVYEEGSFENGIKIGSWSYYRVNGEENIEIKWAPMNHMSIKSIIPSNWEKYEVDSNSVAYIFPHNSEINDNKHLLISYENGKNKSARTSWEVTNNYVSNNQHYNYSKSWLISQDDNDMYFSVYRKIEKNEAIAVLNFTTKCDNKIVQFNYSFLAEEMLPRYLYFFEIIRNSRVNDTWVFPYVSDKPVSMKLLEG